MKTTKKLIYSSLIILLCFTTSCEKSDCAYDENEKAIHCDNPYGNNTEKAGFTVATCYAKDPNGDVGVIYNTQMNSSAPQGEDWGPSLAATHPASWKVNVIGQIFGIAIDKNENIYLAASHIYARGVFPTPAQNTVPAQIYKCTAPSWTATPLFALPNTGIGNLNGTGNIAYDKVNDQLFVSNLEDGKIYRYDTNGTQLGTAFDPWVADSSPAGIVGQDEQVWGLGVNYESGTVKLYFPRITAAGVRSIYSIDLDGSGAFPTGTNPESIVVTNVPGSQLIISDIAFSSDYTKMLIAERGDAHLAKIMSYTRAGSTWSFNTQYFVGANAGNDGENSAGGVDFAYAEENGDISAKCDEFFWATGNFMNTRDPSDGKVYGLEGIAFTGNNSDSTASPNANQDTDLFIDINGVYGTLDKYTIGDVEVFDADECFCDISQ